MKKMKLYCGIVCLMLLGASVGANAATAFFGAAINKMTYDVTTGTCAAWVIPGPQDNSNRSLPDCDNRWVSFDCAGDFGSKAFGQGGWNIAQLAFVTERRISIVVNSAKRLDVGSTQYCTVGQVQVSP